MGQVTGFAFPFEANKHGTIRHVHIFFVRPFTHWILYYIYVCRLYSLVPPSPVSSSMNKTPHKLLVTSIGSLQLWDHNVLQWVCGESLATIRTATLVKLLPTREEVIGGIGAGGKNESFWSRLVRQVGNTKVQLHLCVEPHHRSLPWHFCPQNLPHYIIHCVTQFMTSLYASPSSPISLASSGLSMSAVPHFVPSCSPASSKTLVHNPFSFCQLPITSMTHGKLFALDTSMGAIVWSWILGLGWASQVGGRIVPVRAFTVYRTETGVDNGVPEGWYGIMLIMQRIADNVCTHFFFCCILAMVVYFIDLGVG